MLLKLLKYNIFLLCIYMLIIPFSSTANAQKNDKLILGVGYWEYSPLIAIAKEKNYFSNYNLDVELKSYTSGVQAIQDLCDDKVDLSTASEFSFVSKSYSYQDLRILTSISTLNTLQIIVRKDTGITNVHQLKNKTIALTKGSYAEFEFIKMLNYNDMPVNSVKLVYLTSDKMADAIYSKKIDAAMTWNFAVYQIKAKLKNNYAIIPNNFSQEYHWLLLSKYSKIKNNKLAFQRFLQALFDAQYFLQNNQEEAKKIEAKYSKLTIAYIQSNWNKVNYNISLDQSILVALEDQSRWLTSVQGLKIKMPNFLNFIDLELLGNVNPDAVGIIH